MDEITSSTEEEIKVNKKYLDITTTNKKEKMKTINKWVVAILIIDIISILFLIISIILDKKKIIYISIIFSIFFSIFLIITIIIKFLEKAKIEKAIENENKKPIEDLKREKIKLDKDKFKLKKEKEILEKSKQDLMEKQKEFEKEKNEFKNKINKNKINEEEKMKLLKKQILERQRKNRENKNKKIQFSISFS